MAKQGKKAKIALVGYKLAQGGLERVFGTVSELLQQGGCEVTVIVLENEIEYSFGGTLINLGNYSKYKKYFQLKKELKDHNFDYVIDFRHRINPWMELVFLNYIYAGFKTIYTIHSSKLEVYLTDKEWVAKQILRKAYKMVSVSTGLDQQLKSTFQFDNGVVISNSVSQIKVEDDFLVAELPYKYCIAVGRLVPLKQLDQLIVSYSKSNLIADGMHLVILGDGSEKHQLQKQIESLNLTNFVHVLGFKANAFSYIKYAEFLVLSSKYEGFPMVVLEALSLSTPVISFDCETGPREMIQNERNGLLIENQNFEALKTAFNRVVEEEQLLPFFRLNAKASIEPFSAEIIQKKWLDLINFKTI